MIGELLILTALAMGLVVLVGLGIHHWRRRTGR